MHLESLTPEPAALTPRSFLRPCLLLLLREQPAHGYDLLERLGPFGWTFSASDPGRLYRTLRRLEEEGLIHWYWEGSSDGPNRRVYDITRAGMEELQGSAKGSHRDAAPDPGLAEPLPGVRVSVRRPRAFAGAVGLPR